MFDAAEVQLPAANGAKLFEEISVSDDYVEFLTLPAYRKIA